MSQGLSVLLGEHNLREGMGITCGVGGAALLTGLECGWDGWGTKGGVLPYD